MKSTITVLFARPWSMKDENSGEFREGVSIQYAMTDILVPADNVVDGKVESRGYQVTKESISVVLAKSLESVPGVYEADFSMKASGGKNVLSISGLNFLGVVEEVEN